MSWFLLKLETNYAQSVKKTLFYTHGLYHASHTCHDYAIINAFQYPNAVMELHLLPTQNKDAN